MQKCIKDIKQFCEENNYEIYSISNDEIVVRNNGDMWKIDSINGVNCILYHLNNMGKLQWHKQGHRKVSSVNYVKKCIMYHNTYKKIF